MSPTSLKKIFGCDAETIVLGNLHRNAKFLFPPLLVIALIKLALHRLYCWVVPAGSFRPGSFRPIFGVGRFGPGSFRP